MSLANALGLALVHFAWQGFFLGALIAGTLTLLRDRPAAVRYLVCVSGMTLMLAAPIVTTILLLQTPSETWSFLRLPLSELSEAHLASRLTTPLLPILPLLPVLWGAGVIILQIRMIAAWLRAESLRRVGTRTASLRWQREFDAVRRQLSVGSPVRLLESSRVAVPAVIGWLRPVVLVPATLATGLGPDEIRGLLAHELAHIRRHDYLVNLAQCGFESLLFFHPVTWWLSGRLRAEREFCCDDVALTVGGGAIAYARTLSSLEELRSRTALPALSAQGGCLMTRIMRIVRGGRAGPSRASLVLGVVAVAGGISLGSLMATGCFQSDAAVVGEHEALTAPNLHELAAGSVREDATREDVLDRLDAAVAEGKLEADFVAMIRTKLESGEAQYFTANCTPDGTCELPADCPLEGCAPALCVELVGTAECGQTCVVVECDESECSAVCAPSEAAACSPAIAGPIVDMLEG